MEEKAAATAALGTYAQYCMAALAPQTQPILEALLSMADYFNEEVRAGMGDVGQHGFEARF